MFNKFQGKSNFKAKAKKKFFKKGGKPGFQKGGEMPMEKEEMPMQGGFGGGFKKY